MIARNPLPSEAQGDFPSRRWDQLRSDVADFLASPWPAEAARLGWTELDLFGADADRPYTRIDGFGLVPLLNGSKIVALTAEAAILKNPRRGAAELPPPIRPARARAGVGDRIVKTGCRLTSGRRTLIRLLGLE